MKKLKLFIIYSALFFGFFIITHPVSADTTYISTPNGTTTIVSGPSASTYAPGDTVKVNVSALYTSDPYATHITLVGNNAGAGATNIIDADFDVNSYITALVNVGTAGAPKAGYNIAMTGTVTWSVPSPSYHYLTFDFSNAEFNVRSSWVGPSLTLYYTDTSTQEQFSIFAGDAETTKTVGLPQNHQYRFDYIATQDVCPSWAFESIDPPQGTLFDTLSTNTTNFTVSYFCH